MTQVIEVRIARAPYRIEVEPGALAQLGASVRELTGAARVLLAMDEQVVEPHGSMAKSSLDAEGIDVLVATLVAEEKQKSLATVQRLYAAMLEGRLDRTSAVVALGGGVVGDIAGFAAATFLRGVPVVQVPTTLLAMVDASIGGKTGVNHPLPGGTTLGKNLVGAFWQPAGVIIDPETLRTLDPRDFRCGLAECLKHGIIADPSLFEYLADVGPMGPSLDTPELADIITQAADVKARIVADDERESSSRALLNLGHTFGHAIEPIAALDLRHGEAVAIGLCAAAHLAVATNRLDADDCARIQQVVEGCGLPTRLPKPVHAADLLETMRYDKKNRDDRLRLVLPTSIGSAEVVEGITDAQVIETWRALGATDA
ncbi:MAG: 3-dehydroquinate synthase [Planctomycetota bacterium]